MNNHKQWTIGLSVLEKYPRTSSFLVIFSIAFCIYAFSAPRSISLEDDSLFAMAIWYMGIAHSPGYPLFVLISQPFSWLPLDSIPLRFHLVSAFFGALNCALVAELVFQFSRNRSIAWVSAGLLCFSQVHWSVSIITEVYALNLTFFLLQMIVAWRINQQASLSVNRDWIMLGLLTGLSLSNHWPLVVMASPAIAILVFPHWRQAIRCAPLTIAAFLIGLTPYVWMVLRSWQEPMFSHLGSLRDWHHIYSFLSREGYGTVDSHEFANYTDRLSYISLYIKELIVQFSPVGFIFFVIGMLKQWQVWPRIVATSLTAGFIVPLGVLVSFLSLEYEPLYQAVVRLYPLIPWCIAAVWTALGVFMMMEWIKTKTPRAPWVAQAIPILLLALVFIVNGQSNFRRQYTWTNEIADQMFKFLPSDAVIFTNGEIMGDVIAYLHDVEKKYPQMRVLNQSGLFYGDRLFNITESNIALQQVKLKRFISTTDRPIYFLGNPVELPVTTENCGLWFRLINENSLSCRTPQHINSLLGFISRPWTTQGQDNWTSIHKDYLHFGLGYWLSTLVHEPGVDKAAYESAKQILSESYYGALGQAEGLMSGSDVSYDIKQAGLLLSQAERLEVNVARKPKAGRLRLQAIILQDLGDTDEARILFKKSLEVYPSKDNQSREFLHELNK